MKQEKFGIENLKKVVAFAVGIKDWYDVSNSDGKIEVAEYFTLIPQFMVVPDLVKKKEDIINEAKDLSLDEVKELVSGFNGVTQENVIGIIEDALSFVVSGKNLIERFIKKEK